MNRIFSVSKNHSLAALLQNQALPFMVSTRSATNPTLNTHQKPEIPGIKRIDGMYVHEGEVLVQQFNLHYHPGLNVEIDGSNTLRSMIAGKVFVTSERIVPNDSPIANKYYQGKTYAFHKRTFHVMPFKQPQKFNLVDTV